MATAVARAAPGTQGSGATGGSGTTSGTAVPGQPRVTPVLTTPAPRLTAAAVPAAAMVGALPIRTVPVRTVPIKTVPIRGARRGAAAARPGTRARAGAVPRALTAARAG